MTPSQEWEHRQHRQHSPRQASDPPSPNSSVSKPLPVVLLEQLSNQKISGTPGKSNFQMGRTKKIPEKTSNHKSLRNFWENSFQMTPSQGMGAQHRQHSPRQASDPASPNSSVSKPLPVVLLEQLSNQEISGTPGKSNFQMGRTKKIPEKTLNHKNLRNFWENSFQMTPSQGMGAQHRQHSPRQASDPASPNSSVSKPLPVVLLEQLSNQKISGTPGKSN